MTRFSYPRRLIRSLRRVATRYSPSRAIELALPIAHHLRGGQSWVATGCGDHVLIVDATDIYIGGSIMTSGSYGRREFDRAIELLRRHDRLRGQLAFLDVGANIGTHTVYALRSGLFTRVIAVEPAPRNVALLRANIALNGMTDRVAVQEAAAGIAGGTARLYLDETNHGGHSLGRRDLRHSVDVPVVRLDDVLAHEALGAGDVGLVWIDAEGSEIDCVGGMPGMLAAAVPLVLEFNAAKYGHAKTTRFCSQLASHYSSFAVLSDEKSTVRPIVELGDVPLPAHGFFDIVVF